MTDWTYLAFLSRFYEKGAGFYNQAPPETDAETTEEDSKSAEDGVKKRKTLATVQEPETNPNTQRSAVKLSCLISPEPTDDEITLLLQMGVTYCFTWLQNDEQTTVKHISGLKDRLQQRGLILYNVANRHICKNASIILGLADRDAAIEHFIQLLRTLAASGVTTTTFTWEPDGVWNTDSSRTRGDAPARTMDAKRLQAVPLTRGRVYTEEELWGNMDFFLRKVLPVAEQEGVRLALHPNDPPVPVVGGVPCLIRSRAAYERVFRTHSSPYLGMEFCCGCWLEGGKDFGDISTALPAFIAQKRVFIVHLRNVTSPLPVFTETFIDGGYGDMYAIMKLLVVSGYDGTVILDHTPEFVPSAGPAAATAFAVGFIKASLNAASHEHRNSQQAAKEQ